MNVLDKFLSNDFVSYLTAKRPIGVYQRAAVGIVQNAVNVLSRYFKAGKYSTEKALEVMYEAVSKAAPNFRHDHKTTIQMGISSRKETAKKLVEFFYGDIAERRENPSGNIGKGKQLVYSADTKHEIVGKVTRLFTSTQTNEPMAAIKDAHGVIHNFPIALLESPSRRQNPAPNDSSRNPSDIVFKSGKYTLTIIPKAASSHKRNEYKLDDGWTADYPYYYAHNGSIAYDRPEKWPIKIKKWAESKIRLNEKSPRGNPSSKDMQKSLRGSLSKKLNEVHKRLESGSKSAAKAFAERVPKHLRKNNPGTGNDSLDSNAAFREAFNRGKQKAIAGASTIELIKPPYSYPRLKIAYLAGVRSGQEKTGIIKRRTNPINRKQYPNGYFSDNFRPGEKISYTVHNGKTTFGIISSRGIWNKSKKDFWYKIIPIGKSEPVLVLEKVIRRIP